MESMYTELAQYYDLMYGWKRYGEEARSIAALIGRYKRSSGKELLDVACGTGGHIHYLKRSFRITGVDLSSSMLRIARQRFPDVNFSRRT